MQQGGRIITPAATVIIPTYNGRALLERCLSALLSSIEKAGGNHKVLVVDDASTDGTAEYLAQTFPSVEVLSLQRSGFGRAVNSGVMQAKSDAVVLLNNDVVVEPDFLKALLEPLQEPDVFAVGAKFLSGEGKLDHVLGNRTRGLWRRG
ncbi:MAG: glycosyltransferase, partial [Armatimonadetes bacterium]|nr:glycosyltransferase [Armatimonadota bacterium]NIO56802.1 glycosyltransferase [Candidatus Latescibacterota bacterium]NIM24106.1 glycosyltransferase [Armatimonadota bacterium]NIM67961.1 glycosyltransferase [Armatimonadota bacterium]NIM76482.1 glycosyltransferase [Armatimonadota bacterium]